MLNVVSNTKLPKGNRKFASPFAIGLFAVSKLPKGNRKDSFDFIVINFIVSLETP